MVQTLVPVIETELTQNKSYANRVFIETYHSIQTPSNGVVLPIIYVKAIDPKAP